MELRLASYPVERLAFGRATRLDGSTLVIDRDDLVAHLGADPAFRSVGVELAHPGEPVRIVHALDVVEPRAKPPGAAAIFPGFLGAPRTGGSGRTHRLAGVAVVPTSPVAWDEDGISVKEAIVDMSGPGAAYSPFARTANVVLTFDLVPDAGFRVWDHGIRLATLRTAEYLARTTLALPPPREDVFTLAAPRRPLPRVAYVDTLMTANARSTR